jgi:hypothetical protein
MPPALPQQLVTYLTRVFYLYHFELDLCKSRPQRFRPFLPQLPVYHANVAFATGITFKVFGLAFPAIRLRKRRLLQPRNYSISFTPVQPARHRRFTLPTDVHIAHGNDSSADAGSPFSDKVARFVKCCGSKTLLDHFVSSENRIPTKYP